MADLLNSADVSAFKDAMRNVTDTFHKHPVTFTPDDGGADIILLAGLKEITAELKKKIGGEEVDKAYRVSFNREYLRENDLINDNDALLITYDYRVNINGQRFRISAIKCPSVFRDTAITVVFEVVR